MKRRVTMTVAAVLGAWLFVAAQSGCQSAGPLGPTIQTQAQETGEAVPASTDTDRAQVKGSIEYSQPVQDKHPVDWAPW
jgi:hypothetical protein